MTRDEPPPEQGRPPPPGPDDSLGTAQPPMGGGGSGGKSGSGDYVDDNVDDEVLQQLIEWQVREMGPPPLRRREEEQSQSQSQAQGSSNNTKALEQTKQQPTSLLSRSEAALQQRDQQEALAQHLVQALRDAILSWDELDYYLKDNIVMDVFTDHFIWQTQDFITEYQTMEAQTGRAPTIKLCIAFDTNTSTPTTQSDNYYHQAGQSLSNNSDRDNNNSNMTEGRLLARLMEHKHSATTSSTTSSQATTYPWSDTTGGGCGGCGCSALSLPILCFPKTQDVALQILLDTIMHRVHPVLRNCFPQCHLVSLQPCSVIWNNANKRSSKAGEELEAALERAKYLREHGQLLQQQGCSEAEDDNDDTFPEPKCSGELQKNPNKVTKSIPARGGQFQFGSGEFSCATTVEMSQDFTVEMSQDFTVTESEFFTVEHTSCHPEAIPVMDHDELSLVEAYPLVEVVNASSTTPWPDVDYDDDDCEGGDDGRSSQRRKNRSSMSHLSRVGNAILYFGCFPCLIFGKKQKSR